MEEGFPESEVELLHTPVGLSIHAETPEEIAVSVMAEIIEVKNKAGRTESLSSEMLKALTEKGEQGKVLATIVSRRGSAPRKVGTKMIDLSRGKNYGDDWRRMYGGGSDPAGIGNAADRKSRDTDLSGGYDQRDGRRGGNGLWGAA